MRVALVLMILIAVPAAAQQAFSKSMAECAGLFSFGADNSSDPATVRIFTHGEAAWITAALAQATAEGVAEPEAVVEMHMRAKQKEWEDRGLLVVFAEDFNDWIDYCRSFAGSRGIDLKPD